MCELGCASLATILLRNVEACQKLFDMGGDLVLLQILNIHTQKPKVAVRILKLKFKIIKF